MRGDEGIRCSNRLTINLIVIFNLSIIIRSRKLFSSHLQISNSLSFATIWSIFINIVINSLFYQVWTEKKFRQKFNYVTREREKNATKCEIIDSIWVGWPNFSARWIVPRCGGRRPLLERRENLSISVFLCVLVCSLFVLWFFLFSLSLSLSLSLSPSLPQYLRSVYALRYMFATSRLVFGHVLFSFFSRS